MKIKDLVGKLLSLSDATRSVLYITAIDARHIREAADKLELMATQLSEVCANNECSEYCPLWAGKDVTCNLKLMDE